MKQADWLIEMGPEAGAKGGEILAQGTPDTLMNHPKSQIGPFYPAVLESVDPKVFGNRTV